MVRVKIQVISDVHTEFQRDSGREFVDQLDPEEIDVLIVAGDLCDHWNIPKTLEWLAKAYRQVVYVFGNHECYGSSIGKTRKQAVTAASAPNVHFLDNSTCEIDGQRFVGTTMWFPDDPHNVFHQSKMNDFRKIRKFSEMVYGENVRAVKFLRDTVKADDVVVTHYLPSHACVSERFRGSELNRFFVCGMDDLIFDAKPKLWVHGHTHDNKDFMHGDTRIVCNPFGYVGVELNPDYVDQKVVEI